MAKQDARNNDFLKEIKRQYNNGYYKKTVELVNSKGEEFAEFALKTCLVDYPKISGTDLSGLDLVEVLIRNGVSLDDAQRIRLKRGGSEGMDDLISHAKKLL